ncbi:hypothetical protein P886_1980 [Alteromonadaceae bacterium 2753L.S.0a.02]|nr:hypothetical protein P886_1980 [Alteromonadaceae bacterium 2753L.S.0a.02]
MPNYSYIEKFKEAISDCIIVAEEKINCELPKKTNFDLSLCKALAGIDSYGDLGRIFETNSTGEFVNITPTIRVLWFGGEPPSVIRLRVCRIQWESTVIEVNISEVQCAEGLLPIFEVQPPKYDQLPIVQSITSAFI